MADPNPNPNNFDGSVILSALSRFFSLLPKDDRSMLNTIFEQLHRALDDAYHELQQINDSKEFLTLRPFFQRDWLLRDLTTARFIGTPHGHFDFEVTAVGGETQFSILRPLDSVSSRLWIDGVEVPQGQGWTFDLTDPLLPLLLLDSPAMPGTTFRLYAADIEAIAIYTADGTTRQFLFPQMIDVNRVQIFHDQIELIHGIEIRKREVVFSGGLTGGEIVRFQDGAKQHNVVAASGQVRVGCPFDITDSTTIKLGGINLRDGWVISSNSITFKSAPRVGVTIKIQAPKVVPHDHLSYQTVSTPAQTVFTVPENFGLLPGFVYNVDRPVIVFINGMAQKSSAYTFTAANQLTFGVPLLGGEKVYIFYHSDTDYDHAHPPADVILDADLAKGTGIDLTYLDNDRPALVAIEGLVLSEGLAADEFQFQQGRIIFGQKLLAGTRIMIVAEKFQWQWVMGVPEGYEPEIRSIEKIQNGIDYPTIVLDAGVGFAIFNGELFLSDVFAEGWLKNVLIDLEIPFANFGYLIDFKQENSQQYVDLLQALWAAYTGGQSEFIAENFGRIMLGSPYAQFPGVIQSERVTDSGYLIDILGDDGVVREFVLTGFEPAVVVGQRVGRFTALGSGLFVHDNVNTPDWYLTFPLFLYAIEKFGKQFDTSALMDKGIHATYRVTAVDPYDSATHSVMISLSSFDFRLFDDLNDGQVPRCTLFYPGSRFDSRVDHIDQTVNGYQVFLDPAFTFVPLPPGTLPAVEFEFERQRRFDLDLIWDEYLDQHMQPIATQLYSLFKFNLFMVELRQNLIVGQSRLELLFLLLNRIKAAETQYIVLGSLPDQADELPMDIAEADPSTDPANFAMTGSYLAWNLRAFGISNWAV